MSSTTCSVHRAETRPGEELYATPTTIILLYFGRIVREKGTTCFVEAVRELRRRGVRIRPLIVGDGPARAEIKASLGEAVFLGHLDGEELGKAVASADILLNPSLTEAFGNVNLEAMSAGLAVIAADESSASALITHGENGYLCKTDSRSFADVVERLMTNDLARKWAGENASAAAQKYRWADALDAVVRSYRELHPS